MNLLSLDPADGAKGANESQTDAVMVEAQDLNIQSFFGMQESGK